ncbi:cytochrome C [Sulfurimonas aquatica]|uniref:Cytochrome C n=1 Tax=Sulfurimonas aquatica TaxID=2672570 RepID=A0A975B209_9BACT|nr:multiheme c-type cytochrome [Sulfurimonas aquatica]QSZ42688.1 cytochrome C [Sulfurimonas aquatica]
MQKILFLIILFSVYLSGKTDFTTINNCLKCHGGIEHIRDTLSGMALAIAQKAKEAGYSENSCIVCHGGNPATRHKKKAHKGTLKYFLNNPGPKEFYPAPGSTWINQNTCGMCHQEQVDAQMNSLMMTEQGKIQGALWSFGKAEGYEHNIGNYKTSNPTDPHKRLGTERYQNYMNKLALMEPQGFPSEMKELPEAPTAEEIMKDPSLAVYTYLRQECLRCHTGSKGRQKRGDFRGIGCASCHIPYSNEGFYEGDDKSISKKEKGHLLVHSIQSSREVKVKVHEVEYSGVPVETCTTCHNRGKRIGVSYQGLMETPYEGPYDSEGNPQPKLHTKRYMHMQGDIHFEKGMLCQDCHTSNDMHGDGFLGGANLAAVEVECQDCHGTTSAYPWELPLGYSDEFNTTVATGEARGTVKTMAEYLKRGSVNEPKDGYILSARGNPLIHAVKDGDEITIHLASGKDIQLKPLKKLKEDKKLSPKALLAMDTITSHNDNLECYTCHATWAPQCYGCHVKIDYSKGKQNIDYLKASHDHDIHGKTGGMKNLKDYLVDGKVTESRSFLRWEDPALSQNGEGRISPTVPGCQTTITVIGTDGKALLQNHIYKIPNVEGAGQEGQNAIDMSPIQPHTISKESRSCESCHSSAKAMGMGIMGSRVTANPSMTTITDIMSADGKILPTIIDEQIPAIANLNYDYSKFLDENGTQLQTVGHHWKLSGPLSKEQRDKLDRSGMCISCHIDIPEGNLAVSGLAHMAEMANIKIDKKEHQSILNKILNLSAIIQIVAIVFMSLMFIYIVYTIFIKKKSINPRNRGWK